MTDPDMIGLAYGALVALGGFIGLVKAGSIPSFVAGFSFGALAGYGAYQQNHYLVGTVSGVLTLVMGSRFIRSGKIMPAGVVAILSVLMLARTVISITRAR